MKTLWRIEADISDNPIVAPTMTVAYVVEIDLEKFRETGDFANDLEATAKAIAIVQTYSARVFLMKTLSWKAPSEIIGGMPSTWEPIFSATGVRAWKDVVIHTVYPAETSKPTSKG